MAKDELMLEHHSTLDDPPPATALSTDQSDSRSRRADGPLRQRFGARSLNTANTIPNFSSKLQLWCRLPIITSIKVSSV